MSWRKGWATLVLLFACLAAVVASGAAAAAASTTWGAQGASYAGGIVCHLPDGTGGDTTVPMSTWSVDGARTFATADVVQTAAGYGPAPTPGAPSAPIAGGEAGLSAPDIAATAYLIAHHGSGAAAQVAEVSADIAAAAGDGRTQARCLGQQGTSPQDATALWAQAQRFAGPYTISVAAPASGHPGAPAALTATVLSAAHVGTPGIAVTFATAGSTATATTGADGTATASLATSTASPTSVTATVSEATTLTYFATSPAAVARAQPTGYVGTGTVAHPRPVVSVRIPPLLIASDWSTPTAYVSGVLGYAGTGSISVNGPVRPGSGQPCAALRAADFAAAPTVWSAAFTFAGDGTYNAGRTPALNPGCYAAKASISTTNSTPVARAQSSYRVGAATTVSTLQLTESAPGLAPRGPLKATVTGRTPGRAHVTSSVTEYGPLPPSNGQCGEKLGWSRAPIAGTSGSVSLSEPATTPASSLPAGSATPGGVDLSDTIAAPRASRSGCYALSARSVVTQDGATLVVRTPVGSAGSTTLVAQPTLAVVVDSYDGQLSQAMTGTVAVSGSYQYPGSLTIGLVSAKPSSTGCRDVSFAVPAADFSAGSTLGKHTTLVTSGDGTYRFRTPIAMHNLCYAVTAALSLTADPAVRASTPPPSSSAVFLAGFVLHAPSIQGIPVPAGDTQAQAMIAFALAFLLVLAVAVTVIAQVAFAARRPWGRA